MKIYNNIEEITKEDNRWRKLAYKISKGNQTDGDEILNTFYMYYLQMEKPPEINYTYIYQALYNNQQQLRLKKTNRIEYNEVQCDNSDQDKPQTYFSHVEQDHYFYDDSDDIYNDNLYKSMLLDVEGLDYFNRTLFKLNKIDGLSIRTIQKEYNLSYSTIQKSISSTKEFLKNKYTEDEQKN